MTRLVGLLVLIAVGALVGLIVRAQRPAHERMFGWPRELNGWHLAFLATLAVLVAFVVLPVRGVAVILPLAALLVLAWVHEFTLLMRQGDELFLGRYDKPIWALLLIILPPVGLLTFWLFRKAHWPEAKPVRRGAAHDLS
ncbi:MAG: hypothetical protein ABI353_17555 [Isosphaeraceae bacterium]